MSDQKPPDLLTRLAIRFADLVVARPGAILLTVLAIFVVSSYGAAKLTINTNQLDLISQDLRQIKDVKRIIDMVGGMGHLIIALRGNDAVVMKQAADDIDAMLEADDANVRTSTHKISAEFAREHAALLMKTSDLVELRRRVTEKVNDVVKRANPFAFEVEETKPVELKVDDIVDKYTRVGKRSITDDYNISDDRKMLIITVKPMWNTTEIDRTGAFMDDLRKRFGEHAAKSANGIKLVEDYSGEPSPDPKTVQFGFTGSYPLQFDDSFQIRQSLIPVSTIALVGVLLVLLIFFGRYFTPVLIIMLGLSAGIVITHGLAKVLIGELNMITSILAGILAGNGEDFGVFVVYRLREEYKEDVSIDEAIRRTIINAGPASFVSAAGSGVAFLSLLLSDFRGFSQFGLLAGMGIFVIGLTLYCVLPTVILLLDRWRPGLARKMIGPPAAPAPVQVSVDDGLGIPYPKAILAGALALTLGVSTFATRVTFDYNSRALQVENQPTMLLQDELNLRMKLSADPVAIYTKDLEQAKKVYDVFNPLDPVKHSTVDQAVSLFTFIPSREQQEANKKVMTEWKAELDALDRSLLPDEFKGKFDDALKLLSADVYGVDEAPPYYRDLFRHLPSTKPENHGWLTYLYPTVDLWNGKMLMQFSDEVETITTADGQVFHSAGIAVLMATLARIVLHDAQVFVAMTLLLVFLIMLADLKNLREAGVAMLPLVLGGGFMLGLMGLFDIHLNFMNIVVFPIVLAYGVSQGVYLIHRFNEGTPPLQALKAVGVAVTCSTLTTLAGWAALVAAPHKGLKTMGTLAVIGMTAVLVVTFTVMPALLQLMHDKRLREQANAKGA